VHTFGIMSAPAADNRRAVVLQFLEAVERVRPGVTWGELVTAARAESSSLGLGAPGGMAGWLTNAIKVVGGSADAVTFGGASKVLTGIRDIGEDVLAQDKVSDSLKRAGRGVLDETVGRLLDALPFNIGTDYKTGYVVNRYWLFAGVLAVVGVVFFFRRRR
jgi:hypothetical protein